MTFSRNRRGLLVGLALLLAARAAAQQPPNPPNFDQAMQALGFDPGADWNRGGGSGNGIPDGAELAMLAALLDGQARKLGTGGGVDPAAVRAAFAEALKSATADLGQLNERYPTAALIAAGYAMLGKQSFDAYSDMSAGFGAPLKGRYDLARQLDRYLAAEGDADGDGISNLAEFRAHGAADRAGYVRAALDPAIRDGGPPPAPAPGAPPVSRSSVRTLGVVLYPGFEALDVFGPVEMWAYVPEFKVVFIAEHAGPVRSAQGFSAVAEYSFATAPPLDILMVPGGLGTRTELGNETFLEYLRRENARTELTTSVCTGSALLAKAGLLKGRRATSNKAFFSLATDQDAEVEWVPTARWVEDGKFVTSSGVSAGTDMALGVIAKLFGKDRAKRLAFSLEYQWNDDPTNDPFTRAPAARPKP
ncbi:MAG: DJ-1/PfpI family protein [Gemmatimonadales bacterium]